MPTPRIGAASVLVDDKIYVINGFNDKGQFFSTVEIYDPINDTWSKGENVSTAVSFPCCSAIDGKIYVLGGYNGNMILSDVKEYDTGFRPSSVNPQGKISVTWGEKKK